ncbi:hypothetical protein evm_014826 [Chilo suppressalis]|nr:hypothetical protein evm_014826 [Chilo suppressalis]
MDGYNKRDQPQAHIQHRMLSPERLGVVLAAQPRRREVCVAYVHPAAHILYAPPAASDGPIVPTLQAQVPGARSIRESRGAGLPRRSGCRQHHQTAAPDPGSPRPLHLLPGAERPAASQQQCQLLERKMSDDQISFAFERLPKGRERGGSVQTGLLPQHAALNGYSGDSLPYDDNRVRLKPTPHNPHGYINASHVTSLYHCFVKRQVMTVTAVITWEWSMLRVVFKGVTLHWKGHSAFSIQT